LQRGGQNVAAAEQGLRYCIQKDRLTVQIEQDQAILKIGKHSTELCKLMLTIPKKLIEAIGLLLGIVCPLAQRQYRCRGLTMRELTRQALKEFRGRRTKLMDTQQTPPHIL